MTVSDVAAEARRALGRQLAALRQAITNISSRTLLGTPGAPWPTSRWAARTHRTRSGWVEVDRLRKQQRLDEARAARAGLAPDIELSSLVGVYLDDEFGGDLLFLLLSKLMARIARAVADEPDSGLTASGVRSRV